jgi:hypothetical protein
LNVARRQGKERVMAGTSSGMGFLGFVLGGMVVVVAVLAFMVYDDHANSGKNVIIELPQAAAPK